jgi:hypothetical protein
MPYCTEDDLVQLWRESGLENVESAALTIEQRFYSFEDFWAPFLLRTGPAGAYVASLEPERRQALQQRLRQRLVGGATDRPFVLHSRAWGVRGSVR